MNNTSLTSTEGASVVLLLTALIQVLFVVAMGCRSLVRASWLFAAQAVCLVLVYVAYAVYVPNPYILFWAGTCAVLNVWLLPFFRGGLIYTARLMPDRRQVSHVGTILFLVLGTLAVLLVGTEVDIVLTVPGHPIERLGEMVSVNLLGAALLVLYGIISLLNHRHPIKMVIALMMMTEGAHMAMVSLVPGLLSVVKIGILSKVIPSVFMVLYVNRLIGEKLHVVDTTQLSDLKG